MGDINIYHSWRPNKCASEGANMYHEAVVDTSWYYDNLIYMVNMVNKIVKTDDVVVDFGAGTGISALFLLKNSIKSFKIFLVDNSPSWLCKAYELLGDNPDIDFFILEKKGDGYLTLAETIGNERADIVISANTFHLIPNLNDTFKGIYDSLKKSGTLIIQSGNIIRKGRPEGVMMIDNTVENVHNIAIEIIKSNKKYSIYAENIEECIKKELSQRKMIFPDPRPVETYIDVLKSVGFECGGYQHKEIKVKYEDWKKFLRIKRVQAGILPEIGGKNPSKDDENIRDEIVTMAIDQLFGDMKKNNSIANHDYFTAEWIYIDAHK